MTARPAPKAKLILECLARRPELPAPEVARIVGCAQDRVRRVAASHGIELVNGRGSHRHTWRGGASSTYRVWHAIKTRVFNSNCPHFKNYGGRGISMSSEWASSFAAFLQDMGERPSLEHTIDRIDVDGNYEPGNCRWATLKQQHRNRRDNHYVEYQGAKMTVAELVERTGVSEDMLRQRLKRGWDVDRAVATPSLRREAGHAFAAE